MRKALPFLILAALLLVSCSGTGKKPLADACPVERSPIEQFSLCLPPLWSTATEQFGDEGSLLVRVEQRAGSGTLMQIHVKKDPLQEPIGSSLTFAQRAIDITRERAPNYVAISTEPVTIGDQETLLHIFDATPDGNPEPVRYAQFVTTHAGIAYGFTAIMDPSLSEDLHAELLAIFRSVRFP